MDDDMRELVARAKRIMNRCVFGETDDYPGDVDIGDSDALELFCVLAEIVDALEQEAER